MTPPYRAQLANDAPTSLLIEYLAVDEWYLEPKLDGIRILCFVQDHDVHLLNRDGQPSTKVDQRQFTGLEGLEGTWLLDGEWVEGGYVVFDALMLGGASLEATPFGHRRAALERFFAAPDLFPPQITLIDCAKTDVDKAELAMDVVRNGGEGVMLKETSAVYMQGCRVDHMRKIKFIKELDAEVMEIGIDGKDNCSYGVYDNGVLTPIGKCSLNGKPPVSIGDVITVRYLYARRPTARGSGDRLVQPRMMRVRTDKKATDCFMTQVVYTNENTPTLPMLDS